MSALLKLDVFRSLPKDLSEPTFCGAVGKFIYIHQGYFLTKNSSILYSLHHMLNRSGTTYYHGGEKLCVTTNFKRDRNLGLPQN